MIKILERSKNKNLANLLVELSEEKVPFPDGVIFECDGKMSADDIQNIERKYKLSDCEYVSVSAFDKRIFDGKEVVKNDENFVSNLIYATKKINQNLQNDRAIFLKTVYNIPADCNEIFITKEYQKKTFGKVLSRSADNNFETICGYFFEGNKKIDISKIDKKFVKNLEKYAKKAEKCLKNAVIFDFYTENENLYIENIRVQNFSRKEKIKLLVKLVDEKIITKQDAIKQVELADIESCLHSYVDDNVNLKKVITSGLAASSGAACGKVFFSTEKIEEESYPNSILVCQEVSPKDIKGVKNIKAVVACHGGITSHGAVVLRTLGVPGIIGCEQIKLEKDKFSCNGFVCSEGDEITVDANNGNIYQGKLKIASAQEDDDFLKILSYAKEISKLEVYANADTPDQSKTARKFGANGIGVCRTEHMFFDSDRLLAFREMIVSTTKAEREKALEKLLPMQRSDFEGIFKEMDGLVVTIRLLDPPLHEFLPKNEKEVIELAEKLEVERSVIEEKIEELKEFNPMMGHRGLRLFITYPELAVMQTRAIIEGAINAQKRGICVRPEIMIPLTSDVKEFAFVKKIVRETAEKVLNANATKLSYKIGTMMELSRACLLADEIATESEFFSFGTNDLTQMTFGFSRDDAGKYLKDYFSNNILEYNPFERIDEKGVGKFIQMAVNKGRSERKDLRIGVCGEQGANPESIDFCMRNQIDYVSCSPYRIPKALVFAAKLSLDKA